MVSDDPVDPFRLLLRVDSDARPACGRFHGPGIHSISRLCEKYIYSDGPAILTTRLGESFLEIVYNPTTNVPIIDRIKTITMKTQSNIP